MKDDIIEEIKEDIKKLEKIKGQERGADIKYLMNYVRKKKGNNGLNRVISVLKKCNYKLPDIKKVDDLDWVPLSLPNIFLVATVKVFNLKKKDIIKMGREVVPSSYLIKLFIRHFSNTGKTFKRAAADWKKHYSIGGLEVVKFDQKQKQIVIRLKDIKWHPFACLYHIGSLGAFGELALGKKFKKIIETKCISRGDSFHEFVFYW